MSGRNFLIYAPAPARTTAREANERVNDYVADRRRGLAVDPLTFSLSAVGLAAQTAFTLERYRGVSLEELTADEPADPRFWWQRRTA
jgi:hypothetical protein